MSGMDRHTGQRLDGWPHVRQSKIDLLTTRVGTRVQRRDYGTTAVDLVDKPANRATVLDRFVAIADALDRWEPRVQLTGFELLSASAAGGATIGVMVREISGGRAQAVEVPL